MKELTQKVIVIQVCNMYQCKYSVIGRVLQTSSFGVPRFVTLFLIYSCKFSKLEGEKKKKYPKPILCFLFGSLLCSQRPHLFVLFRFSLNFKVNFLPFYFTLFNFQNLWFRSYKQFHFLFLFFNINPPPIFLEIPISFLFPFLGIFHIPRYLIPLNLLVFSGLVQFSLIGNCPDFWA